MARVTITEISRSMPLNGKTQIRLSANAIQYERAGRFGVEIKAGSAVWTYPTRRADGQFAFVPDLSLLWGFTDSMTVSAEVTVRFYENGIETGSATEIVEMRADGSICKPEVSAGWVGIAPDNAASGYPAALYVKDSMLKAVFDGESVSLKYGAKLAGFRVLVGSNSADAEGHTARVAIPASGEMQVACKVTDSRGFSAIETFTITAHAYAQPAISNILVFRADASGAPDEKGAYIAVQANAGIADLGGSNRIDEFTASLSLTGSAAVIAESDLTSGEPALIGGSVVPARSYRVMIRLTDISGGSTTYTAIIPTMSAAFNIMPGGKGAAFNHLAEQENALDITGWDLMARGVKMDNIYLTAGNYDPAIIFGGTWSEVSNTNLPFRVWQREE